MPIEVIRESSDFLSEYRAVPMTVEVRSRFDIRPDACGYHLAERQIEPYIKDYDGVESPLDWPLMFDISNWPFFSALDDGIRVGGAVIAYKTPGLDMLRGEKDTACLWDIRVRPEMRGSGVGTVLFNFAVDWCRDKGVRRVRIETQDVNVPACRFYQKMGCRLETVKADAYPAEMNEKQLIWLLEL